jgi:hypothetical protein
VRIILIRISAALSIDINEASGGRGLRESAVKRFYIGRVCVTTVEKCTI